MADKNPIITVDSTCSAKTPRRRPPKPTSRQEPRHQRRGTRQVEDFKQALTEHNAWDLPFMGYVNEDGYGYATYRTRPSP